MRARPSSQKFSQQRREPQGIRVAGRWVGAGVGALGRLSLLLGLALGTSGCHLPHWEGPVPHSVATGRQLFREGVAAMERGQWDAAESLLARSVKACPEDVEARRQYAEALWHRGAQADAVVQLLEASQHAPEDAELRVRLAEMYLDAGKVDFAAQTAQLALDLDPKLASGWAVRGRVKCARGELRPALADLHRALGLEPTNRDMQLAVADLYHRLNEPQQALVALQNVLDSYPPGEEPQQALLLQGLAYQALGRFDAAAESLSLAKRHGPPSAEILCRLGEVELLAGRPVSAAAAAREALALEPNHPASQELLGRVDVALRDGELSLR